MATLAAQLTAAQLKLAEYSAAESVALDAQRIRLTSPSGMDREEEMANLNAIRKGITYWQGIASGLEARIAGAPTLGGRTFSVADFS
ncbi:hypothetical protein [Polaromonas sp.]|uniref:hypothetical protein n=1 Tax=Polaromonas sp. TaxID=1869339 RepID=UPI003564DD77